MMYPEAVSQTFNVTVDCCYRLLIIVGQQTQTVPSWTIPGQSDGSVIM